MFAGHQSQRKSTLQWDVVHLCTTFNQLFLVTLTKQQDAGLCISHTVSAHLESSQTTHQTNAHFKNEWEFTLRCFEQSQCVAYNIVWWYYLGIKNDKLDISFVTERLMHFFLNRTATSIPTCTPGVLHSN